MKLRIRLWYYGELCNKTKSVLRAITNPSNLSYNSVTWKAQKLSGTLCICSIAYSAAGLVSWDWKVAVWKVFSILRHAVLFEAYLELVGPSLASFYALKYCLPKRGSSSNWPNGLYNTYNSKLDPVFFRFLFVEENGGLWREIIIEERFP